MEKSGNKMSIAISWFIMLYFVILFAERVQSMARIVYVGNKGLLSTPFDSYADVLTCCCLLATLILLAVLNRDFLRSLFDSSVVPNYGKLSVTAGVILIAGMVDTEYTIGPMQFGAYGALIVAMILRTVETAPAADSKLKLWYSLFYLVVFSMSIPVMHHSFGKNAALYHIVAAATALILVACFTYMMRRVFIGEGEDLLLIVPFLLMAALVTASTLINRDYEINTFALIFAIAAAAMFVIGKIIFALVKK
ncbi:hypothetical protein SAMN02910317_02462 [Ruminococcaceae bacterium FB2012]|nr:hypothetical protein SAMN02910317_02462 [Ruminococcaceae bacterium FB2012]